MSKAQEAIKALLALNTGSIGDREVYDAHIDAHCKAVAALEAQERELAELRGKVEKVSAALAQYKCEYDNPQNDREDVDDARQECISQIRKALS